MKSGASLAGDPLLRLVGRIYDGAVDSSAWPGIVRDIVAYVGGSKGLIFTSFSKHQLRGLFEQTATHRQADLVRMLLAIASNHVKPQAPVEGQIN